MNVLPPFHLVLKLLVGVLSWPALHRNSQSVLRLFLSSLFSSILPHIQNFSEGNSTPVDSVEASEGSVPKRCSLITGSNFRDHLLTSKLMRIFMKLFRLMISRGSSPWGEVSNKEVIFLMLLAILLEFIKKLEHLPNLTFSCIFGAGDDEMNKWMWKIS